MSRSLRVLIVALILAALVGLVALGMWQLQPHEVSPAFVTGVGAILFGTVLTALNLTLSDDYIRSLEWDAGKDHVRQLVRRGWYALLIVATLIGLYYLDQWMLAAR